MPDEMKTVPVGPEQSRSLCISRLEQDRLIRMTAKGKKGGKLYPDSAAHHPSVGHSSPPARQRNSRSPRHLLPQQTDSRNDYPCTRHQKRAASDCPDRLGRAWRMPGLVPWRVMRGGFGMMLAARRGAIRLRVLLIPRRAAVLGQYRNLLQEGRRDAPFPGTL